MEFNVDHVEEITTEPESEEEVGKLYINRLLGDLSSPRVSQHGLSPEIGLLSQRGSADSNQIIDSPLTDLRNQFDAFCKGDEASTNIAITKGRPDTAAMTSINSYSQGTYANAIHPQLNPVSSLQHPKPLATCGLSQGACSESSTEDSQRNVRKHAQEMSRTIRANGKISENMSKESGCRNSSSGRCKTSKVDVKSHLSIRGQQRLGGGARGTTLNQTSNKRKMFSLHSIHKRNKFGETHIHLAAMKGDLQSVKDMIEVGASVNLADNAGWTPLHEAVLGRHYAIAETLLKAGALVNSAGFEGVTPLQDAVHIGDLKIINMLLNCGADPLMTNLNGNNAIELNQDKSIEKLLKLYADKHTKRTRQSAAIDADENQQTSEANVCPDEKDVSKENDTSSANAEGVIGETIWENNNTVPEELLVNQSFVSFENTEVVSGGSGGSHETYHIKENDSGDGKKKIQTSNDQNFLDYLLNFDLNSVSVHAEISSSTNELNQNVCNYHPSKAHVIPAQSNIDQENNMSSLPSCQTKVSEPKADVQCFPTEESYDSSGSQSLLTGLIHDQGLTGSPQLCFESIEPLKPTNKQLNPVHQIDPTIKKTVIVLLSCKESQQKQTLLPVPAFHNNAIGSKLLMMNTDTLDKWINVPNGQVIVESKEMNTELSSVVLQSNDLAESMEKPHQILEDKVMLFTDSHCSNSSVYIQGVLCGERLYAGSSELQLNAVNVRGLDTATVGSFELPTNPLFMEKQRFFASSSLEDDQINNKKIAVVENDDAKSCADSDCTVIEECEQFKNTECHEDVTSQAKLHPTRVVSTYEEERQNIQHNLYVNDAKEEQRREEPIESTTSLWNTESSVSMLTDLSQNSLCLFPTPVNNTESAEQVRFHKLVGKKDSSSFKTNECKKKRPKQNCRKQINNNDMINAVKNSARIANQRNNPQKGVTLLHKTCKKGKLPEIKRLIKAGININIADNSVHRQSPDSYVDKRKASGSSAQHLIQTMKTTRNKEEPRQKGALENEPFMNITSIRLISNEELLPTYVMDKYWDSFINNDDWIS